MGDCKGAAVAALVMLGGLGCGSDVATFGAPTTSAGAGGSGAAAITSGGKDDSAVSVAASSGAGGGMEDPPPEITGEPIDVPEEEWTWVPFEEALCANGESTGIGVNFTSQSKEVVIFLMGGGACWDGFTCYIANIATHVSSGYDEKKFSGDKNGFLSDTLMFNRTLSDNPFRDANYVYVPYCTGDVHAGNNVPTYSGKKTHHVGAVNMEAYLQRIVATFPDAERVILSGSSAGGFGAGMHWGRTQEMFGKDVPVFLIDDSGPTLPNPYLKENLEQTWKKSWGLETMFPKDCPECVDDFDALFSYYAKKYPDRRGALLSYTEDSVISFFFQIGGQTVNEGLNALAAKRLDPHPNLQYFYVPGSGHVMLNEPENVSQNGVQLVDWLSDMLEGKESWKSVKP